MEAHPLRGFEVCSVPGRTSVRQRTFATKPKRRGLSVWQKSRHTSVIANSRRLNSECLRSYQFADRKTGNAHGCGTVWTRCGVRDRLTIEHSLGGVLTMSLGTILLIVLVLVLLGVIPTWPHSRGWGYMPSGIVGLVLLVLLVLFLMGRI